MWTSAELKMRAKGAFYKNYWHCVLTALIMSAFIEAATSDVTEYIKDYGESVRFSGDGPSDWIYMAGEWVLSFSGLTITASVVGIFFLLVKIFLGNVLVVGGCRFFIMNQTANPNVGVLGYAMNPQSYGKVVLTMFLKNLYESLWYLLLFVPGCIKHYEYLMIPYILAENPEMDHREAFLISKKMMMGQKLNAFALDLTFIGWIIVTALTFGIAGVFFVKPYYQATFAEMYSENRRIAYEDGYIR